MELPIENTQESVDHAATQKLIREVMMKGRKFAYIAMAIFGLNVASNVAKNVNSMKNDNEMTQRLLEVEKTRSAELSVDPSHKLQELMTILNTRMSYLDKSLRKDELTPADRLLIAELNRIVNSEDVYTNESAGTGYSTEPYVYNTATPSNGVVPNVQPGTNTKIQEEK